MIQMKQAKYGGIIKGNPPETPNVYGPVDYAGFNFTPLLTLFNQVVLVGGVNIIPAAQVTPLPCNGIVRITVSETTGVTFSVSVTRAGHEEVIACNAGAALAASAGYTFDFFGRKDDEINFQFGGATTIQLLNIDLVRVM